MRRLEREIRTSKTTLTK
jgi:Ca2+-binding EF-hand superfamily protein